MMTRSKKEISIELLVLHEQYEYVAFSFNAKM